MFQGRGMSEHQLEGYSKLYEHQKQNDNQTVEGENLGTTGMFAAS